MLPNNSAFKDESYVEEDGIGYYRWKTFSAPIDCRLTINFVSTNSPHKQGIALGFPRKQNFQGKVFLNGKQIKYPGVRTNLVVGDGQFPDNRIILEFHLKKGYVNLSSASQTLGDYPGMAEQIAKQTGKDIDYLYDLSWTSGLQLGHKYGSAFWIEPLAPNRDRYHCNDHVMDDDFDDLIFDVEMEQIPPLTK